MAGDPRILVNDSSVNVPAVESWLRSQFNSAAFKPDKRGTNVRALAVTTGEADVTVVYPKRREGRTKWWDVAPAHAIVEAAGGRVEGLDGKAVRYDAEDYQVPQLVITAKREAGLDTLRRGMMPPSKTHDHRRLD
jgi:3'-phosphoadenosine 5'-phosphosulfate (PAPS) 3'-phosphatase